MVESDTAWQMQMYMNEAYLKKFAQQLTQIINANENHCQLNHSVYRLLKAVSGSANGSSSDNAR
jgi:hypothetical protein